ncbi:Rossmann-fold NAD(P)-binding domain-containing protein [Emticicia fontis]
MARIFITGSADGLGQLAAKQLIKEGHRVVLHARNAERAKHTLAQVPEAEEVLIADLSSMKETKELAAQANTLGTFDAVIHNAGVYRVPNNSVGAEGLPLIFTVNSLAPYILTCMMHKPERLIYMSSGMHLQGNPGLDNLPANLQAKVGYISYSDTKLHEVMLSMAVARKWTEVYANAVNPGWVPTRMGGAGAPDSLEKGFQTQTWLAVSNEAEACVSGRYFHHKRQARYMPEADNAAMQDKLLKICEQLTGVSL